MGKSAHVCTSCSLQQLNIALECELKSLHHYSSYSGLCFHNAVLGITAHQHPPTPLPLHKSRHIFKAVVVLKELISSQAPLDVLVTIPCRFLGNAFFDLTNQLVEFVKMCHSTNKRKYTDLCNGIPCQMSHQPRSSRLSWLREPKHLASKFDKTWNLRQLNMELVQFKYPSASVHKDASQVGLSKGLKYFISM